MVFLVNQGDMDCPHVCIAHVSCFQSLLRSLYYLSIQFFLYGVYCMKMGYSIILYANM